MDSRQGPHHVAQNSTMYAVPFSNSLTGSPCTHLPVWSLGAWSPTLRVVPAASNVAPDVNTASAVIPVKCILINNPFPGLVVRSGGPDAWRMAPTGNPSFGPFTACDA